MSGLTKTSLLETFSQLRVFSPRGKRLRRCKREDGAAENQPLLIQI